ncbi:MAG: metalloregulator ArsR/SmtB family transcription factor [Actinomycetota bacterium]|nr:metalloregulator ArsR/SmtB family transcription factor [Actinomycetota bacterium]MDQ3925993.1 metalloregulator ArsR/SmtB family transcription factor [Actinomycetota bacterium]
MARRELQVVEAKSNRKPDPDEAVREERVARLVALGQALSDPIRVRMLGLMAAAAREGRGCCGLPDLGAPAEAGEENIGVCVCEFEDYFGMGQSKVSYHVRKLRDAGLIREEKRGKWSFYSLDQGAVRGLLDETAGHLGEGETS